MAPDRPTQQTGSGRSVSAGRGEHDEHQVLVQRRLIAGAIGVVVLLILVFGIKGCLDSRHDRGLEDFVNEASSIVVASDQGGKEFFKQMRNPSNSGPTELETSINEQRSQAAELVRRAEKLSAPGDMDAAKLYLIQTLEFRRDGLEQISGQISQALGDEQPEEATEQIAADMQNFLTSDVIYSQRSYAEMVAAMKKNDLATTEVPTSVYLPSLDWLDPATVDDVLSRSRGATAGQPVAPGLHGTGIVSVKALPAETALTPDTNNQLTGVKSFGVEVQNQGENDETDIIVTISIAGIGRLQDTIAKLAAGESTTVTIPVTRKPAKGQTTAMKVEVRRVPGEKNVDNNRQAFSITFND